jgi:hypothetical protein
MTLPLLATKLLAGGMLALGIGAGTLGAVSTANRTAIDTAITNKDLTAYKSATIQAATDAANNLTQDQLNTLSDRKAKMLAVQTAIDNNDYTAFKASADTRMLARVTTQAQFDTLVTNNKTEKAEQEVINTAIKNNDFAAFKAARLADNDTDNNKGNRPVPTDAQLQTRFDAMVAQYKADDTLPQVRGNGMEGFGGGRGGRHGGRMKGFDAPDGVTDSSSSSSSSTTAQ